MKFKLSLLCAFFAAILISCSGSKEPSALIAHADRLNGELGAIAEESPMFLDSATVNYADGTLAVNIAFADTFFTASEFTDALVQYTLAQYMKSHTGANLDEVVNTISKEEGKMAITLIDRKGGSKTFDVPAARLRQLVKLKPMELNYNDARANVLEIMEERDDAFELAANAEDVSFEVANGFAQYTFTFPNANGYARLKQAQLTGRCLNAVKPIYDNYGACRTMVEDLLKSFKIDGYRFVYENNRDKYTLKASVPWRTIN